MLYGFLDLLREKKLSEFNYDLLKEGLIKSSEYSITIDKINDLINKHNLNGMCKMYVINDRILVEINDNNINNKVKFFNDFLKLLDVTGYFVSNYKINNQLINQNIDLQTFTNNSIVIIYLNKKFDSEAGVIPEFLYHVTEEKYIDRIRRYGLINKSKQYIENHPERIYFFENINNCLEYIDFKQIINPIILKIDVKTLNNLKIKNIIGDEVERIKLYNDPKYQPINAYYSYDNIPPYSIVEI
jgi:hypothetical protein